MVAVVLTAVALALLAATLILASLHRRDLGGAIGALSKETIRSDRSSISAVGERARPPTGRAVERAAALERRRESAVTIQPASRSPVSRWVPPDTETIGVTRRQFFNRTIVALMGLGLASFGGAVLAFLWTRPTGGFGAKIRVGHLDVLFAEIDKGQGFYYRAEGRMWITRYPPGALEKARAVYSAAELVAMEAGLVALYQKCPHLGCRVPDCKSSQWFECPCHGSQYNRVGEKRGGPAPRGMDRFTVAIDAGVLTVDTSAIIAGPPVGTNTTGQEAEGPHCVSLGGE
jgi:cytochrome b6-f complex iron-sulfur subunit